MNHSSITTKDFKQVLENSDDGLKIDVREPGEYRGEHVKGTENIPLSRLGSDHIPPVEGKTIYLFCKTGARSGKAAEIFLRAGARSVQVVEGGLDDWKQNGFATVAGAVSVWSLERQVRLAAGFLVVSGVVLSATVHTGFIWLSGFVGLGLIFAAVTNTCGMAMLLARMPWNQ